MIAKPIPWRLSLAAIVVAILTLTCSASVAQATAPPIKEVHSSTFGQTGVESSAPGGFEYPRGVAVQTDPVSPQLGDIYIADGNNSRVQDLTATGTFVLMFGKEVNKTKKTNLCTQKEIEAEHVECQAGVKGSGAGQFAEPTSVTVDPSTGHVYVEDFLNARIQEFTEDGEFILMVGQGVDGSKGNICTKASGDLCQAGTTGSSEPGAFELAQFAGNTIGVGGPEDLLYVASEARVQEFKANGTWVREFATSKPAALAVDAASGDVYFAYAGTGVVHKLGPKGEPMGAGFSVRPSEPDAQVEIAALALDSSGRLAVTGFILAANRSFGSLYEASTGRLVTEFTVPAVKVQGLAFSVGDDLYAVDSDFHDVWVYEPLSVGELSTSSPTCKVGAERETDATFTCALSGKVDPWGVSETKVWAEWGTTSALGNETEPPIPVISTGPEGTEEPKVSVSPSVEGLKPNETIYYQLAGNDHNVKTPELFTSETSTSSTPTVPPKIVGPPVIEFVKTSSAVMYGQLNPENASTRYEFQYAPEATCASLEEAEKLKAPCPGTTETASLESSIYGKIGVTREAGGLQPATPYRYRLVAENENQAKTEKNRIEGEEGTYTTVRAPSVVAETGGASVTSATSAVVSGTVDPDGAPATYTFELGIYRGAETRYGVVFSGPVAASIVPVAEPPLVLSGLQPGTEYAYRIAIKSGYSESTGAALTFKTAGLPSIIEVPTPLAMLAVPTINFPKVVTVRCKRGYDRDKQGKCVRARAKKKTKKKVKKARRSSRRQR